MKRNKKVLLLVISLVLCLISAVSASHIQTKGGAVKVSKVRFETEYGTLSGMIYKPTKATKETPRPAIVATHGYLNSNGMQDINAIELSRRGFVVLAIDIYGHGASVIDKDFNPGPAAGIWGILTYNAGGVYDAVNYLYTMEYVDKAKIGLIGHSFGSLSSNAAVDLDNAWAEETLNDPKISAVLIAGAEPVPGNPYGNRNVGVVAGKYDEFFYKYPGSDSSTKYLSSSQARAFINDFTGETTLTEQDSVPDATLSASGSKDGYFYKGDAFHVIYQPDEIHPLNHFSVTSSKATIEFYHHAFGGYSLTGAETASSNQVWYLKEAMNFVGLIGFYLSIVAIALLLLEIPVFSQLIINADVKSGTAPKSGKAKFIYWGSIAVTIFASTVIYLPIMNWVNNLGGSSGGAVSAYRNNIFGQTTTNEIVAWAFISGIVAIVIFTVSHSMNKKETGALDLKEAGVNIGKNKVFLSFIVAITTLILAYDIVWAADFFFNTDFRIWTLVAKPFSSLILLQSLVYLPFFAIFYMITAFTLNHGICVEGRKEWMNYLLISVVNSASVIIILLMQYIPLLQTGYLGFPNENLRPILAFNMVPILIIAAIFSRYFYKKTGNVWIAGFLNTMLVTIMTCANTFTGPIFH